MPHPTADYLCKRAYVPVTADNDQIVPSNIGALKLGLKLLQLEDESERAYQAMIECEDSLDELLGGPIQTIN